MNIYVVNNMDEHLCSWWKLHTILKGRLCKGFKTHLSKDRLVFLAKISRKPLVKIFLKKLKQVRLKRFLHRYLTGYKVEVKGWDTVQLSPGKGSTCTARKQVWKLDEQFSEVFLMDQQGLVLNVENYSKLLQDWVAVW